MYTGTCRSNIHILKMSPFSHILSHPSRPISSQYSPISVTSQPSGHVPSPVVLIKKGVLAWLLHVGRSSFFSFLQKNLLVKVFRTSKNLHPPPSAHPPPTHTPRRGVLAEVQIRAYVYEVLNFDMDLYTDCDFESSLTYKKT